MRFLGLIGLLLLSACNLTSIYNQLPTPTPTPATIPAATITPTPTVDTWTQLASGLETRPYQAPDGTNFRALRIDPAYYTFRAHYQPDNPQTLSEWRMTIPDASAFINANFFDRENNILGLLVSDGIAYGRSYGYGGTFVVQDGIARVRSTVAEPYYGEYLEQAVQAFPLLVHNRQAAYARQNEIRPARRTVIGQDSLGRIIIMATTGFGMGLYPMSQYLPTTDLDLVTAFNLDGGGSTMLYSAVDEYRITSFDRVPAILAIYAR